MVCVLDAGAGACVCLGGGGDFYSILSHNLGRSSGHHR